MRRLTLILFYIPYYPHTTVHPKQQPPRDLDTVTLVIKIHTIRPVVADETHASRETLTRAMLESVIFESENESGNGNGKLETHATSRHCRHYLLYHHYRHCRHQRRGRDSRLRRWGCRRQRGEDVVVLGKERRARGEGFYDTLERPHSANLGTVALILQQGSQRVIHLGLLGGCSSELRENGMMSWYSAAKVTCVSTLEGRTACQLDR